MITKIFYSCILGLLFISVACNPTSLNMPEEIVLTVYHYKVPCVGENVRLCYRVKKNDSETQFFYDEIEGFDYDWGFNYTIRVEKVNQSNPVSDASSFTYKLKEVIKKEEALPGQTFDLPLKIDDQSLIESKNGVCSYLGEIEIKTSKYSCDDLLKAQSATFSHDSNNSRLVLIGLK
jgi:Domain of unknown function (DUF4377)